MMILYPGRMINPQIEWQVPENLPAFDGHFPGDPILPAVAIIEKTVETIREVSGLPQVRLERIKNAKFLNIVRPQMRLVIELANVSDGRWKCSWKSADHLLVELDLDVLSS